MAGMEGTQAGAVAEPVGGPDTASDLEKPSSQRRGPAERLGRRPIPGPALQPGQQPSTARAMMPAVLTSFRGWVSERVRGKQNSEAREEEPTYLPLVVETDESAEDLEAQGASQAAEALVAERAAAPVKTKVSDAERIERIEREIDDGLSQLRAMSPAQRGQSLLLTNVSAMLCSRGRLLEASEWLLPALAERRLALGDRALPTLTLLNHIGLLLLQEKARIDEAAAEGLGEDDLAMSVMASPPFRANAGTPSAPAAAKALCFRVAYAPAANGEADGHAAPADSATDAAESTAADAAVEVVAVGPSGHARAAKAYLTEAAQARRELQGDQHEETLTALNNLGAAHSALREWGEAEKLYREVLASRRQMLGDKHPDTFTSANNLGRVLLERGKVKQSAALFIEAFDGAGRHEALGRTRARRTRACPRRQPPKALSPCLAALTPPPPAPTQAGSMSTPTSSGTISTTTAKIEPGSARVARGGAHRVWKGDHIARSSLRRIRAAEQPQSSTNASM